jgi:hypothetical protein
VHQCGLGGWRPKAVRFLVFWALSAPFRSRRWAPTQGSFQDLFRNEFQQWVCAQTGLAPGSSTVTCLKWARAVGARRSAARRENVDSSLSKDQKGLCPRRHKICLG